MNIYPVYADLHTHTVSSGHGSTDTLSDLARAAAASSLTLLGISDHGPATPGAAGESYFRGLPLAPRTRFGIKVLYGAEVNIINEQGDVDLSETTLAGLDYAFISLHPPTMEYAPGFHISRKAPSFQSPREENSFRQKNTAAFLAAMHHTNVRFLGHIDDGRFPMDFELLLKTAADLGIYPEINNGSLVPDAYRANGHANCLRILHICKRLDLPILLSSDSHGAAHVGDVSLTLPLLRECDFPAELVLNSYPEKLAELLQG